MATNPVHPPITPSTPPHADHKYDELSGVYGFFRRHQKKLLYTAGLFTLLTFSISGPMMSAASEVFGGKRAMPTIEVNGKRVNLQPEDAAYGEELARKVRNAVPPGVLPMVDPGEGGQLGSVYEILRRAAIEEGIEPSMLEVDRAIETFRERANAVSAAKLATNIGFGSLAQYRTIVAEAMRIGTYMRLQTLALDGTDARVLKQILNDREKITLHVATFDEKKAEEDLKKEKTLGDDELQKWLEGKAEREKQMMGAYDPPRSQLRFGALLLADDQFDPEQWKDTALKDFTVGDDRLQPLYEQEKALRFTTDKPGEFKPMDDAAVKAELTRLVQAEEVMKKVLVALQQKQNDTLKPLTDALIAAQTELGTADTAVRDADVKSFAKQGELAGKKAELEKKPDDAELKQQVATLETEAAAAAAELTAGKERATKAKDATKAADDAVKAARATWDFDKAFAEETKDKRGFVTKAMDAMKSGEDMKDLDKLGLDLGDWPFAPSYVPGLREKGALSVVPGRTKKAVVLYQAMDVDTKPLKPWDKLKPLAEGAYWTEQAKKLGDDKQKLMEEALLRRAKAAMPERVTELEGQRASRVDKKLAEWEQKTNGDIALAEQQLKRAPAGSQMQANWQRELTAKQTQLGQKEQQRTLFDTLTQKEIEGEIATEAKKHYKEVLNEAAAEAGFTVSDVGPFQRDLQRMPRFDKNYDPTVVYLMRSQSELKVDEATEVLHDPTNRRYHVAVCTKVEPLTAADVTRRDFESLRTGDGRTSFASVQTAISYGQAFTQKAVETRYGLQKSVGEQKEPK